MADMVKTTTKMSAAFKQASTTCSDADLKAWAAKRLATLQEHQREMANSLHGKAAGTGAASKSSHQP